MKARFFKTSVIFALLLSFALPPNSTLAEELMQQDSRATMQSEPAAPFVFGSIIFSLLLFPAKLLQCIGTQTIAAVAYVGTFGVEGNYDGGTNGKDIGTIARHSCNGSWIVSPSQVASDYGE